MSKPNKTAVTPQIEQSIDGHELSLSADKKWLRLTVAGKTTISFHVNYVNKVLNGVENGTTDRSARGHEPTATL